MLTKRNIKAQGETVQRVLVDGKRFFGDDPLLATKNFRRISLTRSRCLMT
jgi:hypothetical protein